LLRRGIMFFWQRSSQIIKQEDGILFRHQQLFYRL
jgi:hypothetical protein